MVYTRFLRKVKHLSWRDHPTKRTLYGSLKPVSVILKAKRAQFAGQCFGASSSEVVSSLLLWKTKLIPQRSRKLTFQYTICRDSGLKFCDLETAIRDRDSWRQRVESVVSMMMMMMMMINQNIIPFKF